jgi:hypothetical protein
MADVANTKETGRSLRLVKPVKGESGLYPLLLEMKNRPT